MYERTDSYVLLDTSYMYNKYPYMSDLYIIPKTCTRTCLFLEYPGVMIRSVLKIDMGRWESHPGPSVSVMTGAATPRLLVVETSPSQNLTVVEIQYGNLSLNSLRFFGLETTVKTPRKSP